MGLVRRPQPYIENIPVRNRAVNGNFAIFMFRHAYPHPLVPGGPTYFDFDYIYDCIQPIDFARDNIKLKKLLEIKYSDDAHIRFIVVSNNKDIIGSDYLFLPYYDGRNWIANRILVDRDASGALISYKVSCGVISVNKTIKKLTDQNIFYRIMHDKTAATNVILRDYCKRKRREIRREQLHLITINTAIYNNLLWLGLKQKTLQRKILSCAVIDVRALLPAVTELILPVTFDDADTIGNIRVDVNNPEVVIVFGKFKATVVDGGDPTNPNRRPDKIIHNVMVIYTNLQNDIQNDANYGNVGAAIPYALGYDNFKELTINEDPMFKGFYSCVDGLVAASTDKGAMQQNIGVLMVKNTEISGFSIVGFHNGKLTAVSEQSTADIEKVQQQANPLNVLCYDYNMCADTLKIAYDEFSRPRVDPTTKLETGVFNPMTFYAFYIANKDKGGIMKPFTELFKGVYALIDTKVQLKIPRSPQSCTF